MKKSSAHQLLVRFSGRGQEPLLLPASRESFPELKKWLTAILKQLHTDPRESKQFLIAADEIFSNIVKYAYVPEDNQKQIEISLNFDRNKLRLSMIFSDRGIAFNPLTQSAELPKERIQKRIPGGLGLFLVHRFMDELTYRRDGARNVLTITKVLHKKTADRVQLKDEPV